MSGLTCRSSQQECLLLTSSSLYISKLSEFDMLFVKEDVSSLMGLVSKPPSPLDANKPISNPGAKLPCASLVGAVNDYLLLEAPRRPLPVSLQNSPPPLPVWSPLTSLPYDFSSIVFVFFSPKTPPLERPNATFALLLDFCFINKRSFSCSIPIFYSALNVVPCDTSDNFFWNLG